MKQVKRCARCGAAIEEKDVVAFNLVVALDRTFNLKVTVPNGIQAYCMHCLIEALETTEEETREKIAGFKTEGCKLFQ